MAIQNANISSNGNNSDEIEIVLAGDSGYSINEDVANNQLIIRTTDNPAYTWTNEIAYQSALVANAILVNEAGVGNQLILTLKKPVHYYAKVLTNPRRVVITLTDSEYSCAEHKLAEGVVFKVINYRTFSGKVRVYLLDVAPESDYRLRALLDNKIIGRTKLSVFANRIDILAAINGSYFAPDGEIIGALKIDGKIISSDKISRAIAGFTQSGDLQIDINEYRGQVVVPDGTTCAIDYVNRVRTKDSLILYNSAFGLRTLTNNYGVEYVVDNDTVVAITDGNSAIPGNGAVLSATGLAKEKLSHVKLGDKLIITQTLGSIIDGCYDALGAGPQLVKDGKIAVTSGQEKVLPDIAVGRAPRTAIAETKNKHILLVVVDGRQAHSIGMTLNELSDFLVKLSAEKAMNLDGGGSSAMLVHGRVLSLPSDGVERPVASAIALVRK